MPELPEVETIKNYLKRKIVGKRIISFKVLNKKSFLGQRNLALNKKILRVLRRGKLLILELTEDLNLVFHLKLTGQVIYSKNKKDIDKFTRVFFVLKNKHQAYLIFKDIRKFGWIKLIRKNDFEKVFNLGPEPFSKRFSFNYLKNVFFKTKKPIKLVLMDQQKIAGIGNIYSNEALFLAKIHPLKPANQLKDEEIKELIKAIKIVLKKGIKYGGTSYRDYIKPDKKKGGYQEKLLVYHQQICQRCKSQIKRIKLNQRSVFYCPQCQK